MSKLTFNLGVALIVIGLAGYFLTGMESLTALIPTALGIPIAVLGMMSKQGSRRGLLKIAVVLALVGAAGTFRGLLGLSEQMIEGITPARPAATYAQSAVAVLCILYSLVALPATFLGGKRG